MVCAFFLYAVNIGLVYCPIVDASISCRRHANNMNRIVSHHYQGKGPSSLASHESGGGGVADALPTQTPIGNGARFVMADQVSGITSFITLIVYRRLCRVLTRAHTAVYTRREQAHHDKARRACIALTVSVTQLAINRYQTRARERSRPKYPGQNKRDAETSNHPYPRTHRYSGAMHV